MQPSVTHLSIEQPPPTPTCRSRYLWGEFCGQPAVVICGIARTCGCPNTPSAPMCAECLEGVNCNRDCWKCLAKNVVTLIEPVRVATER
jgi:hypothetical protein